MKRAAIVFEGTVQGVFFRANAQRIAREMKLTGWVRNEKDGSVHALVEGSEADVEELVARLKAEVRGAEVRRVRVKWSEAPKEFNVFSVEGDF